MWLVPVSFRLLVLYKATDAYYHRLVRAKCVDLRRISAVNDDEKKSMSGSGSGRRKSTPFIPTTRTTLSLHHIQSLTQIVIDFH